MYNQHIQSPSLYVGDLAADVTEQTLHEVFSSIGTVASIRVCRDHVTRQSLGYAYVNFHNATDADRAIQTLNFTEISGRQCRIMWSQRDPALRKSGLGNIFIKNLDPTVDNKSLMDLFSVFGNILSCKVSTDGEGKSKGYGYVHFDSIEAAKKAIEKYDGNYIVNQKSHVSLFQRREDREKAFEWTNIYIKNIPQEWNEERLRIVFSEFGNCTSIKISRDLDATPDTPHRGFGFVNFESHESAKRAVDNYTNKSVEVAPGHILYVARFKSKQERQREKDKNSVRKYDQMQRYSGVNLYVKNLEDSVIEDDLKDLFSKFGNVISTRVMRDASGYSRGFGFVSFSNVEEARRAITELNNCSIWGKPIKVYLALTKDQRKAQNQASQQIFSRPGVSYPPSMFTVPMYMQPNQPVANNPRPFSLVPVMPRPGGPQRPPMPFRGYPIPPYTMNQFPGSNQAYPNAQQPYQPQPQSQPPQQQQPLQQQAQKKVRPVRPVVNQQRNQRQAPIQSTRGNEQQNMGIHPDEPLTSQYLASIDENQRKVVIGERLYPKIFKICAEHAPKVTGMLLEMENTELLHLLETDSALKLKVDEAIHVLETWAAQAQSQPQISKLKN